MKKEKIFKSFQLPRKIGCEIPPPNRIISLRTISKKKNCKAFGRENNNSLQTSELLFNMGKTSKTAFQTSSFEFLSSTTSILVFTKKKKKEKDRE